MDRRSRLRLRDLAARASAGRSEREALQQHNRQRSERKALPRREGKECDCDGGIKRLGRRRGAAIATVLQTDATDLLNAEVAAAMALLAESTAPAEPPYDE